MKVFTLRNAGGMELRVMDYGGIILSLRVPDRHGRLEDVVLGFDSPEDYAHNPAYMGAIIGRFANRIGHGRFTLDGRRHTLATNDADGVHHLHGGRTGFDAVVWEAERVQGDGGDSLVLRHESPDGDEGYPGTLEARVRYTLTDRGELAVDYHATTDRATPVNLTQHSYFNLAGSRSDHVLDHVVTIAAHRFTPIDATTLPTGEIRDLTDTPLDFREPTRLGARIEEDHEQLRFADGYDHNFVLSPAARPEPRLAARVYEPRSGRVLEVHTTEPGMQLYTGNGLDGSIGGKDGVRYGPRAGFALETQHFPDSPNRPRFPSTILRPGEGYRSRTVYSFGVNHD